MNNPRMTAKTLFCLILLLACSLNLTAKDKKIRKKDVPAPVISAFETAYPDAKIKGYSTETENGTLYYEIESIRNNMSVDALLLPDGKFYEVEETMQAKDLPAAVSGAVASKHPKVTYSHIEKVTHGSSISYDLSVIEGKSKISFTINSDGKILKETRKEPKASKKTKDKEAVGEEK